MNSTAICKSKHCNFLQVRLHLKCDVTRAETRFCLSPKRTSPFKLARASVQSTAGSRGVRISVNNAGYTMFRGSVRVLATHSIHQFPLHFPSRASPCAIRFQTHSTITSNQHTCFFFFRYSVGIKVDLHGRTGYKTTGEINSTVMSREHVRLEPIHTPFKCHRGKYVLKA